ncbi:MAG: hypothetical protein JWP35_3590 [Caulobacter sp.]|jgi:hypothetical protein|nr:hypothetical protein [Caulobacter sp.]
MSKIIPERMTADMDGEFVVFLIGARINRWWKIGSWWLVFSAMPRMLIELAKNPGMGLLHVQSHFGFGTATSIQYWRSFEALEAYAKNREAAHLPAWAAFNKAIGSNGDVGIWHETYVVKPGQHESVYNNMPPYGLGRAGTLVPATGARQVARTRMAGNA